MNRRWRLIRCFIQHSAIACVLLLATGAVACKYSVRDVAFVNVHGSQWQLVAVAEDYATLDSSHDWHPVIDRALEHSNVEYQRVSLGNPIAAKLTELFSEAETGNSKTPRLAAMGPTGRMARVWPPDEPGNDDFEASVRSVVESPLRDQILDLLPSSLCVLLIVEGNDAKPDGSATNQGLHAIEQLAKSAAETLSRQMWTLDKAPELGPQVVIVSAEQRAQEEWMLWSLGMDVASSDTQAAVIYGQGRLLGQPVSTTQLTEAKLVQWMSICGRDCECDLDRAWLYGTQMMHVWHDDRARATESQLDFDPHSALVMVEANQILMRSGAPRASANEMPQPSGLIIHDLPALDEKTSPPEQVAHEELPEEQDVSGAETYESLNTFQGARMAAVVLGAIVVLVGVYTFRRRAK